jgi:hypothetical protein
MSRLGPNARLALRRGVESALRAGLGRSVTAQQIASHADYAEQILELAMIRDSAEQQAADAAHAQDPHG